MATPAFPNSFFKRISYSFATKAMLALPAGIIVFHLLIVVGVIPYSIVWGGRLTSVSEMLRFESISIAINLFVIFVIAIESGRIRQVIPQKAMGIILWALLGLFVANTVANLFSVTSFEKIVFTPLIFLFALCTYRIILERRGQ